MLMGVLLWREIHLAWSGELTYATLLVLGLLALRHFRRLSPYLEAPVFLTLLAMGFFTYAITVSVDQGWWNAVPGLKMVQDPLEETMEVLGHILIGSGAVVAGILTLPISLPVRTEAA
jgi:hypothetical protein